jgi:hypothetical protein
VRRLVWHRTLASHFTGWQSAAQVLLACRLHAEAERVLDRAIAASTETLARRAAEALAEQPSGLTEELDPDR